MTDTQKIVVGALAIVGAIRVAKVVDSKLSRVPVYRRLKSL